MAKKYNQPQYGGLYQGSAQSSGFKAEKAIDLSGQFRQKGKEAKRDLDTRSQHLARVYNVQSSQLKADQAANLAKIKAFEGLLSLAGKGLDFAQQEGKRQEAIKQNELQVEAAFALSDPSALNDLSTAAGEKDRNFNSSIVANEKGLEEVTDDGVIQNAVRQTTTAPSIEARQGARANAYSANQQLPAFYNQFVTDLDRVYTRPDGTTFTSGSIRDSSDVALIDITARREFYRSAGLAEMDTATLANTVVRTMNGLSSNWVNQMNQRVTVGAIAEAQLAVTTTLISGLDQGDNIDLLFQDASAEMFASGGYIGNPGAANKEVVKQILDYAVENNRPDLIEALDSVEKVKGSRLGTQYRDMFDAAREGVADENINNNRRTRRAAEMAIQTSEDKRIFELASAKTPEEEVDINNRYIQQYDSMGNAQGRTKAAELRSNPEYSPFTVSDMAEQQRAGYAWTNDELTELVADGQITAKEATSLGWDPKNGQSKDTARSRQVNSYSTTAKSIGKAIVTNVVRNQTKVALDSTGQSLLLQGLGDNVASSIQTRLLSELDTKLQLGELQTDGEIRQFLDNRSQELAGEVTYDSETNRLSYEFEERERNWQSFAPVKSPKTGLPVLDLRGIDPMLLPPIDTNLLNEAAILSNRELVVATQAFKNNTKYPQIIIDKAAALQTNPETLLRSQYDFNDVEMPVASAIELPSSPSRLKQGDDELSSFNTGESYGGVELDQLRDAIITKESGRDFSAVNTDSGALGYGQVMPKNVRQWTTDALGYPVSQREFLRSPEIQMQVINDRFRKMLQQQAALGYTGEVLMRRVASIWYSGQAGLYDNTSTQTYGSGTYPSISSYTMDVVGRYRNL